MRMSRFKMQEGESQYVSNEAYVTGTAANENACIIDHRLSVRTAYPLLPPIYSNQVSALRSNKPA